jgi:hypothetical protein
MSTILDPHQILKRVFNPDSKTIAVELAANTNISLDKDEDSDTTASLTSAGALVSTEAPTATTVVIPSETAVGYTKFSIYSTGYTSGVFALEIAVDSPATVWFEVTVLDVSTVSAITFVGAASHVRVRVKTDIIGTGSVALALGA